MQTSTTKFVPRNVQLRSRRKGSIPVLAAVMMTILVGMLAFAIDLGYLLLAREELQRSADSAALAATWELVDKNAPQGSQYTLVTNARTKASQFAGNNSVLGHGPAVATQDVQVGYLSSFTDPSVAINTSGTYPANAVRVILRKTSSLNGRIPFFFANALGVEDAVAQAETTAAVCTNFGGFKTPADGSNLDLLPFALDIDTWNNFLNNAGSDSWKWNSTTGTVQSGSDGIKEFNLYPQGTGSPGNRGTVDIGSSNNSTADIARQIVYGVSSADLAYLGGKLQFNANGELYLNGDTGISAGVKDELQSIVGKTRIIPIFSSVTSPGNNAQYTIKKFVGVRILEVVLTGKMSSKRLIVQPATVLAKGGIPSTSTSSSYFVYSPAWIVR